jgi:hypothetical protein
MNGANMLALALWVAVIVVAMVVLGLALWLGWL